MPTLKQMNELNRAFWDKQNKLTKERVGDPVLVQMLNRELQSYSTGMIPARYQKSVDQILEEAAENKRLAINYSELSIRQDAVREQARKAGRSKRSDALQQLIVTIVQTEPEITATQLLDRLQEFPRPDPVDDVDLDEGKICYRNGPGKALKSAPISGLKDRLSRAKKFLNSR